MAGLLDQFLPNEDEANKRALTAAALALLGTRKGGEGQGFSRAGLLGMAVRDQSLENQAQNAVRKLFIEDQLRQRQAQEQAAQGQAAAFNAWRNLPGAPGGDIMTGNGPPEAFQTRNGTAAAFGATPSINALPTQIPAIAGQQAAGTEPYAQKLAEANAMEAAARRAPNPVEGMAMIAAAQKLRAEAEGLLKFRDENQGFETVIGPNGPTLVQRRKYGAPQEMPYQPKPEISIEDFGGRKQAIDKLRTAPGMQWNKTMTPSEAAARDLAERKFRYEQQQAGAGDGKPQLNVATGQYFYPPSKEYPTGRVVTAEGFQPPAAGKELTESQGKASMYLGMMRTASNDLDKVTGLTPMEIALARGDVSGVPQFMQNLAAGNTAQRYMQSALQWTEAMLRFTTGATAPPEEVKRTSRTFFPQVGDGEDVILQKAQRRADMEKFIALAAGTKGAAQVGDIVTRNPADTKTVVKTGRSPSTGKTYVQYSDGTVEEK